MSARDVFETFRELKDEFEPAASHITFDLKADSVDMVRSTSGIWVRMSYPVKRAKPTPLSGRRT